MWPMIIGAGLGALTNKKNPLEGALMGGTLGYAGGALGGGLLADNAINQSIVGGGGEAFGSGGGLLANLPTGKQVSEYAQPIGQSLAAAGAAKNLLGTPQTQLQSHAPQVSSGGSQVLAQLYQPYQMQPRQRMNWG